MGWAWLINAQTIPGTGTVKVTRNGVSATTGLVIPLIVDDPKFLVGKLWASRTDGGEAAAGTLAQDQLVGIGAIFMVYLNYPLAG